MALVVAENLVKSYGKVRAVDGLSLSIEEGGITALIGPNGAGKTTTIKMILGLLRPDAGNVKVLGEDPWDNPEMRKSVGVVYEKAFFPSHQKVLDYLQRACRIFGTPEERALEVLKAVDLQAASNRTIKALSAGMLQKFAIAHGLINHPRLLIADEMTANLDPEARTSLLELILQLHKDKVTLLLSSHILPELSRVCDSVAIINQGKALASGKLNELYAKFGAGMLTISTDKPEELAEEVRKLPYVNKVHSSHRGIEVQVSLEQQDRIYQDAPGLAKAVDAKLLGIETGSSSLEELYALVVSANRGKDC